MQEVIPPQTFANDVLITKSLSLPFLEQIEYLKMHLHKRGMYTLEEIQERHSIDPGRQKEGIKGANNESPLVVEDIEKQDVVSMGKMDDHDESKQEDLDASSQSTFQLSKFMGQYSQFTSFLQCTLDVKPTRRPTAWLLHLIEEIYDERYKAEFISTTRRSTEIPFERVGPSGISRFGGTREDSSSLISTSTFVYHILKSLGLKSLGQTCWDFLPMLVFCRDIARGRHSMYLREIWMKMVILCCS